MIGAGVAAEKEEILTPFPSAIRFHYVWIAGMDMGVHFDIYKPQISVLWLIGQPQLTCPVWLPLSSQQAKTKNRVSLDSNAFKL